MNATTGCRRRHAVVTGASSGIGRATALQLAATGWHVYAGVRTVEDGERLGPAVTPLLLDVTDVDQIAAAAATVGRHTSELDGLVNNAGVGLASPAELLPLGMFRHLVEVNVTGSLAVTQALLPLLRAACGRIVIVSTIGVRFQPPFAGALDATKAALSALGDALRQELAPWGVRVVLVEPAAVDSAAVGKVSRDAETVLAAASPSARALYEDTFRSMLVVMRQREANGSSPAVPASTIRRALTVARPRRVYLTGRAARRMAMLSLLPTPALDALRRRIFSLPAPGALVSARGLAAGRVS
jgi:NAD(P)-dependent dehydrogenase (short-subunit alcohol dehydrogenase family)